MSLRLLLVGAVILSLAACGAVPQPFRGGPKITTDNPLLDVPTAVGIAVLPVRGMPAPLNTQISTAVAQRLQSFEIPAEAVPANLGVGFTLEAEANEIGPSDLDRDVSVVLNWTLRSRRGATVRSYSQVVSIPATNWAVGDEATAGRLGNEAALAIGDMINGIAPPADSAPATDTPRPQPGPAYPSISAKPVEDAPGDGRESLRLAVLQALNTNGVRRDDVNPDVTLTCQMIISPFDATLQKVEIIWRAVNRSGQELGTVKLDNTIPIGALDGAWGPTAFAVADAALNDLLTLLLSKPPNP